VGVRSSIAGGVRGSGSVAQPASASSALPRIRTPAPRAGAGMDNIMWLILLEAFGALALLVFIVWWTMFSGRRGGERKRDRPPER
jgi:hypothetical protein